MRIPQIQGYTFAKASIILCVFLAFVSMIVVGGCGKEGHPPATIGTGSLSGNVILPGSQDNSGVKVSLLNTDFSTFTDRSGFFKLEGVPEGPYTIRMEKEGYSPYVDEIEVKGGEETILEDVQLKPISIGKKLAIVFSSEREGVRRIYMINPDGTELRRITFSEYGSERIMDYWPFPSPDGSSIAFIRTFFYDKGFSDELWVVNPDGSNQRRLIGGFEAVFPCWSPDGSKIAFIAKGHEGGLYIINADGSGLRKLDTQSIKSDFFPSWSPDGERIAFYGYFEGSSKIFTINFNGSGLKMIAEGALPEWSPRGDVIIFMKRADDLIAIYSVKPDGTGEKRLTDYFPLLRFSSLRPSDGEHICFAIGTIIYLMGVDGSTVAKIDVGVSVFDPVLSPDGKMIAFTGQRKKGEYGDIYVVNVDGSGLRNLTDFPGQDTLPAWIRR